MGRVSIVLITWNSARFLSACAAGIVSQRGADLEMIVVDNASADGLRENARRLFPTATFIDNDENRGYSAAANQGFAAARGDLLLFLNPDVRMSPDFVRILSERLEAAGPDYGSATGKLLRGAGEAIEPTSIVDSKGIRMTRSGRHFDIASGEPDRAEDREREVFGVSGAAALHRRAFLEDVAVDGKPFDEMFFAYREDADLAWRGRLRGWRALYVPEAVAYHVRRVTPEARSALPPEINMHSVKNRFLLRLRNQGVRLALRDAIFTFPRDLVVIAAAVTVERSSLPAFSWLWKNRRAILAARTEIQGRRKVSDGEIGQWFT